MAEELGERTEAPTGRRLSEARNQGRVAKSQDLSAAVDLVGGMILLMLFGAGLVKAMGVVMRHVLSQNVGEGILGTDQIAPLLGFSLTHAAMALGPVLLILAGISLLSQVLQVGWHFTLTPLTPKMDRLNFVAGLGRLLARRNMVKALVDTVKLVIVLIVAWAYLSRNAPRLAGLPLLAMEGALWTIGKMAVELAAWLLTILLIIGIIDFVYQKWQHTQDLKMTRQEVKDERRSMDGDPQIKARRFRMARDIALQRISQAVPRADVVVTNPTHFSVAIQYDPDATPAMAAPRVVAKGVDYMAMRIRQVAITSGVPMVERPPLARALFYGVEVGQEIRPEHYQAVAEILAYVYRLEEQAA